MKTNVGKAVAVGLGGGEKKKREKERIRIKYKLEALARRSFSHGLARSRRGEAPSYVRVRRMITRLRASPYFLSDERDKRIERGTERRGDPRTIVLLSLAEYSRGFKPVVGTRTGKLLSYRARSRRHTRVLRDRRRSCSRIRVRTTTAPRVRLLQRYFVIPRAR